MRLPALARTPRALLVLAAASALALTMAACASDAAPTPTPPTMPDAPTSGAADAEARSAEALLSLAGALPAASAPQGGIYANGVGAASGEPDVAVVTLGVEATALTVRDARDDAAYAFAEILAALRAAGVSNDDIRTTQFSIQPRYEYYNDRSQLVGFQVTNTLRVTIRDLDSAGDVVDDAVMAGGDLARVQSIGFRIEDTSALEEEARIAALADAVAKADLYAQELGIARGAVVSVSETSYDPSPYPEARFGADIAFSAAAAPTEFFAGEYEVQVRVQVVFAVE